MNKWIYIMLLIISCQNLTAQNNCDNLIEEATELYNEGNYDNCISMLEIGLKTCTLTKRQKENAYILLINASIEKDSLGGIDKNFRLLLINNPVYKTNEYNGIDDFKKYFKKYTVYPKFSIGIRPYYCIPKVIAEKKYDVLPKINNKNDYKTSLNFKDNVNADLFLEYRVVEKISFFGDAGFFALNFNREISNSSWRTVSEEKTKYYKFDIGNKIFFKSRDKLNYYLLGGFSAQYLRESKLLLTKTIDEVQEIYSGVDDIADFYVPFEYDTKNMRNPFIYSLLCGVGAIYKVGYFGIGMDLRGYYSLNTINNKGARFAQPSLIQNYYYVDNDVRMVKTDLSIVFTYSLYKVKSKKVILD